MLDGYVFAFNQIETNIIQNGILILAGGKKMFSISMKTNLSLVLRSSHINLIQIKKKKRGDKKLVQVNYCISWYVILLSLIHI